MRIVYIIRSLSHLPYHESILRDLCKRSHRVVLLVDEGWSKNGTAEGVASLLRELPTLSLGWSLRRHDFLEKVLSVTREWRTFASYVRRSEQSAFYRDRWQSYLPPKLKWLMDKNLFQKILTSSFVVKILDCLESSVGPDRNIKKWVAGMKPDLLVGSPLNMRFSDDIEYIKAARSLGIPTAGIVLSWDNLTTKGLFHARPDFLFAWNLSHTKEAIEIHGFPKDRLIVSGSPFFDKWFNFEGRVDINGEQCFYKKTGLSPNEPFILYLGSSANIIADESPVIRHLVETLRQSQDPRLRDVKVLVRPHPANWRPIASLSADRGLVVYPSFPFRYENKPPENLEDLKDFYYSMLKSVAVVGINTSGMLDAIACNRPTIGFIEKGCELTQTKAQHFKVLLDHGTLSIATSGKECAAIVSELLNGLDRKEKQRKAFINKFIRPLGVQRSAGEVVAEGLELIGRGVSGSDISRSLSGVMEAAEMESTLEPNSSLVLG